MAAEPSCKIFIRGIASTVDENGLELAFSKYGRIMEVLLLRDKETKASRGLGFITFECTEDCEDAIRGMNGQELKGSILKVEIATEKPGYQTNPRGRGFVRGGRRGFPSRGVERGRFRGRGGRPFGQAPANRAPVRGRGAFIRGAGAFESQRERFPGPAEYGNGREPYRGLDMHNKYPPRFAPNAEPRDYQAPSVPHYSYPNRPEGSRGPEGDYEGPAATWSRNSESGYPPNAEYSRQDPGHAYDTDYDSVDCRGYEAGYGLVDCRAYEEGYPPPPMAERSAYSYDTHADYSDPGWNREYDVSDRAGPERRPPPSRGYGMADPDCYESAESRSYGVDDGYGVVEPDGAYGVIARGVQRSERSYQPPMDSYATPDRDYCSRERSPDYRGLDSWRGCGGADPSEYGYGPVEEVESRGMRDREIRSAGPVQRSERREMDTRGPQRPGYGPAEWGVAHRSYPARESYRREAAGPDLRTCGYPDPLRYVDLEIQGDEFYEDRRGQRNPRSRGYPDDGASGDYVYPDPALERSQEGPYGAYGSASAHSEGFSGGRPTRGLHRGSRGNDSGMRHPPQRPDAEEPQAKRKYVPETRGSYWASRGRMPLRGSGRRAGWR